MTRWPMLPLLACVACNRAVPDAQPSPAEIADRGWRAHELVVAAGERAATCADAGIAMQRVFVEHREDFVAAVALDNDRDRLAAATDWIAANEGRYDDLELRMEALSDRCADDATVRAAFRQLESP